MYFNSIAKQKSHLIGMARGPVIGGLFILGLQGCTNLGKRGWRFQLLLLQRCLIRVITNSGYHGYIIAKRLRLVKGYLHIAKQNANNDKGYYGQII